MGKYFISVFLFLASATADAKTFAEIKALGTIRVAVDGTTPPFNYFHGNELTGFEIDLAQEIAQRLALRIEWVVLPFNTILLTINQDRFDLVATSHTITPERSTRVDFIEPHYCTGAYIVTKRNGPKKIPDIQGKKISVAIGTVYFDKLKTLVDNQNIVTVPNEIDGYLALQANRVDAWVTQKAIAISAFKSTHQSEQYEIGEDILPQTNAMMVIKGNKGLQTALNQTLNDLIKDGQYDKLRIKYIPEEDIRCR